MQKISSPRVTQLIEMQYAMQFLPQSSSTVPLLQMGNMTTENRRWESQLNNFTIIKSWNGKRKDEKDTWTNVKNIDERRMKSFNDFIIYSKCWRTLVCDIFFYVDDTYFSFIKIVIYWGH